MVCLGRRVLQFEIITLDELKAEVGRYSWINSCGLDALNQIANSLSQEDLCSLIIGITKAEKELRWIGGSAASVSPLFRHLQSSSSQVVYEPIADWVIANRGNDYIPYGTTRYHGSTHAQCMDHRRALEVADVKFREDLKASQEKARLSRNTLAAQKKNTARDRGTPIQTQIVNRILNLPAGEQLTAIALDEKYSPGFYPKSIPASATADDVRSLDPEVVARLQQKLVGKAWGPWKKLKAILSDVAGPASHQPSKRDYLGY